MVGQATAGATPVPDRRPVELPDGGAAWRALYEGPPLDAELVEDEDLPMVPGYPLPCATAAER